MDELEQVRRQASRAFVRTGPSTRASTGEDSRRACFAEIRRERNQLAQVEYRKWYQRQLKTVRIVMNILMRQNARVDDFRGIDRCGGWWPSWSFD